MNSDPATTAAQLQQLLSQHLDHLNDHSQLWKTILAQKEIATSFHKIAESCARNTELMIQQCTDANTILTQRSLDLTTAKTSKHNSDHLEAQPTRKRAKKKHDGKDSKDANTAEPAEPNGTFAPPVEDPSGLFSIDSNPTPVEELLKNTKNATDAAGSKLKGRAKRRRPSQDLEASTEPSPPPADKYSVKRKKTKHGGTESESVPAKQDDGYVSIQADKEYNEAFEQKVALRMKEKDENKRKKADKKRKRDSDVSAANDEEKAGPMNAELALHLRPPLKPGKRRRLEKRVMREELEKERADLAKKATKGEEVVQKDQKAGKKKRKKSQ